MQACNGPPLSHVEGDSCPVLAQIPELHTHDSVRIKMVMGVPLQTYINFALNKEASSD